MAYTYHSDRKVLAEASLNNLYTNEKRRGYSNETLAPVPWHTDRGRSSSDGHVQIFPAADHRIPISADSPTSATSLRSKEQTPRRLVSGLTCYFWAIKGHCKHSSEECLYAHENTGKLAQVPVQVEEGKPAVAGRNALNPHPVYINWKQEHSRSANPNPRSEVQQRVDHIEAKVIQNSPYGERQDYLRDLRTMHQPHSNSAPETISNPHISHGMLSTQPPMSRQRAEFQPCADYSASHEAGALHQPFGQDPTNYSPTTPYSSASFAHQSTQQTSPGHHQAYCPQPIDHLVFENLKYEQKKTMRAKDQAIYQFTSAIDLAIKNMEESQQSNNSNIKKLMDVVKIMLEKDELARSPGNDDSSYRGGGKLFDPKSSRQGDTHVLAPAQKRKITGKHMLRYDDTNYDLPYELTAIAENLAQTQNTAEHNIERLKRAKQTLGFAFENIGEQDVLPQGWIQHFSPK